MFHKVLTQTRNVLLAGIFFVSVIAIITSLFFRYKQDIRVDVILENPVSEVRSGQSLSIVRADYDEPRGCAVRIQRWMILLPFPNKPFFVDQYETTTSQDPPSTNPVYSTSVFKVPDHLAPGTYLYYVTGNYYCNMIDYMTGGFKFKSSPIQIKVVR